MPALKPRYSRVLRAMNAMTDILLLLQVTVAATEVAAKVLHLSSARTQVQAGSTQTRAFRSPRPPPATQWWWVARGAPHQPAQRAGGLTIMASRAFLHPSPPAPLTELQSFSTSATTHTRHPLLTIPTFRQQSCKRQDITVPTKVPVCNGCVCSIQGAPVRR